MRRFGRFRAMALLIGVLAACVDAPSPVSAPLEPRLLPISRAMVGNDVEPLPSFDPGITEAWDVNSQGYIAGRATKISGTTFLSPAVVWTPDGRIVAIELPGTGGVERGGEAAAINDAGTVAGSAYPTAFDLKAGFVWTPPGRLRWLETVPGYPTAQPFAISASGDVVGMVYNNYGIHFMSHAALWPSGGGVVDLGTLPGGQVAGAFGINARGQVVGYSQTTLTFGIYERAFIWSPWTGMRDLGTLGGRGSNATAINEQGEVAGIAEVTDGHVHAFLWTEPIGMRDLGTLSGSSSSAADINDLGQIVGNSVNQSGKRVGFVWTPDGGMQELADPVPRIVNGPNIRAISSTGLVVGVVDRNGYGNYQAYVWHLSFSPALHASAGGPYAGDEGSAITFDGSASTGAPHDALSYEWDFGDSGNASGATSAHAYADDGSYKVRLVVKNGSVSDAASTVATIRNVSPTIRFDAVAPIVSGSTATVRTTFSDPGIHDMPWRYEIDFGVGDRMTGSAEAQSDPILATSPRYCAEGIYPVTASVTDKDGGSGHASTSVTVGRLAIPIELLTKTLNPRSRGELPIAVYGTPAFDPTRLDLTTISLGNGKSAAVPVSRRPNGEPRSAVEDINGDGRADLVLQFAREQLETAGLLVPPSARLILLGQLLDGCQEVSGSDAVRILGKD